MEGLGLSAHLRWRIMCYIYWTKDLDPACGDWQHHKAWVILFSGRYYMSNIAVLIPFSARRGTNATAAGCSSVNGSCTSVLHIDCFHGRFFLSTRWVSQKMALWTFIPSMCGLVKIPMQLHSFSVNIWVDVLCDKLLGPYILPQRLNGTHYHQCLVNVLPTLFGNVPCQEIL